MSGNPDPGRRPDSAPLSGGGPDVPDPDAPTARVCELCGGPALERHCKIVCMNCGFVRDCSDP